MKRTDLLEKLQLVEPAIARKDLVPLLSCFCFTGEHVYGWDDSVGIRAPCATPFAGGVRARVLSPFLSGTKHAEVDFEPSESSVVFKCGRSKLDAPIISADSFSAEFEDEGEAVKLNKPSRFREALDEALVSLGLDGSDIQQVGVGISGGKRARLYSTDNKVLTRSEVRAPFGGDDVNLHPRFAQLFASLSRKAAAEKLVVGDGHSYAAFSNGIELFGRNGQIPNIEQYDSILESVSADAGDGDELPKGFVAAIERAQSVVADDTTVTEISTLKNKPKLVIETKTTLGHVRDILPWKGSAFRPVRVLPRILLQAVDGAASVAFGPTATVFSAEHMRRAMTNVHEG